MATRSIRRQLVLTMLLTQAMLAIGLLGAGVFYTHRRLEAALDASLEAHAMSVAALVRYPEDGGMNLVFERSLVPKPSSSENPDLFQVRAEGIGVVARSLPWPERLVVDATKGKWMGNFSWQGVPYRGLRLSNLPILDTEGDLPPHPPHLEVIYAMPTLDMGRQVWKAGVSIAVASAILLGITVLLALWGIRRGLLPLEQLAGQAIEVSAENWDFRAPPEAELVSELRPLTQAMKTMLDRLHQSFLKEREFLGNAAHELKTPVAILKSTIQSLLRKPRSSAEYQSGLERAVEDVERLEKLLRWMLRLARAEQWAYGTLERKLEPIDIGATCEAAIEGLRGLALERNASVEFQPNESIMCRADAEDLELVWVNLLENALRYSPPHSSVRVAVSSNGRERAKVVVEDQGPGIGEHELAYIFDRFQRGNSSRTRESGGFGLGLAIAKALVEAYGGTIQAESSLGSGTRMIVELPMEPEAARQG